VRLLLVQVSTALDPRENRSLVGAAVSAGLDASGPVDVVVLPEAAQADFGGPQRPPAQVAEPLDGPFATFLAEVAARAGATVVAGMFEAAGDGLPYNTLLAVRPDGSLAAAYRKAHLYDAFGYSESHWLRAGDASAVTVDVVGRDGSSGTLGLLTCYDLRFPEQARALVDAGADVLLVPAAWLRGPAKEHHWATLLAARAIENTVFVAGVAKAGSLYCGLTRLVDPMGQVVAGLGEQDGSVVATVSAERVRQVRAVNPSLANRRWRVVPGRPEDAG
jgi:predicted amidohydrolase